MLNEGTQIAVQNALNSMIEQKIVEYSSMGESAEEGQLQIGNSLQLSFMDDSSLIAMKDVKSEEQIL